MREFHPGAVPSQISEYSLYTDSRLIGEWSSPNSPHRFINLIPFPHEAGKIQEAVTLRISWVVDGKREFSKSTDTTSYHGGWATDELAALASLRLGIRLMAGGETRIFGAYSNDPLGTPISSRKGKPDIFIRENRLILPSAFQESDLQSLEAIDSLRNVSESQFIALVRSARQFQNAIWIAESEPELAWLILVSAIETAACEWASSLPERSSAVDTLRHVKPDFSRQLLESGGEETVEIVANQFADTLQATKKFLNFCMEFLPEPPEKRPAAHAQIPWDRKGVKKILDKIYAYRSFALHAGVPFPSPLCKPPELLELSEGNKYVEVGTLALAVHTLGASWRANDLPISMNTFSVLVKGILNRWWDAIGTA
jgi:hypothetical protein